VTAVHPLGDLERLFELEQRLEARLADARREAERLVADAEAAATARARALEAELVAAASALDSSIQAEREQREREIAAAAAQDAARFESVSPGRVRTLAQLVVERLLQTEERA